MRRVRLQHRRAYPQGHQDQAEFTGLRQEQLSIEQPLLFPGQYSARIGKADREIEAARARDRGEEVEKLPRIYADVINHAIADRPHDMVITTHVCRGNFRSTWVSEGGYEPIAERLFCGVNFDGYFLEYDSDRSGGFEPLAFVPKNKRVVLGLVSSKKPEIESKDQLKRRIEEAAKFFPLENLCLSPQCGFASTHHGNKITEDVKKRKLALLVEVATEVWGSAA